MSALSPDLASSTGAPWAEPLTPLESALTKPPGDLGPSPLGALCASVATEFCLPFVFIFLRIAFPTSPLFSQPSALPGVWGSGRLRRSDLQTFRRSDGSPASLMPLRDAQKGGQIRQPLTFPTHVVPPQLPRP